jgi:Zn-dependent peptidase ImmA (M78 family)
VAAVDDDVLTAAFRAHKEGQTKFTRRMAIDLADFFDVSVRQLICRLETLGLVKRGTWDWFVANGGFTKEHYEQARRDRHPV